MGTHPIFESDFNCLTDFQKKNMDPELEALRRARMQQMQGGGEQAAQKQAQMEEMTNNMLGQILDQSARARLNNIAMVDANKAKKVEAMLITMARQGQISSKMNERALAELLKKVPSEKKSEVKFERRRIMDSDDSDSD